MLPQDFGLNCQQTLFCDQQQKKESGSDYKEFYFQRCKFKLSKNFPQTVDELKFMFSYAISAAKKSKKQLILSTMVQIFDVYTA